MRNLINFLITYSTLFLFLFLEIISFTLVVRHQEYQKSIVLSSSNSVVASFFQMSNSVVEFFKLSAANESLSEENTQLKNELLNLQNQLNSLQPKTDDSLQYSIPPEMQYKLISAKVINNSTNKLLNYITINKGKRDGVHVDMGVISEEGVVGIVKEVSDKFAVVIPILNQNIKLNAKFKHNNYNGLIMWDAADYRFAQLQDIARHVEFSLGDTLTTSAFTRTFPEGIPIGTVDDFNIKESDPFYNIKIKLAVNFRTLTHVRVINYLNYNEQNDLELKAQQ